MKLNESNKSKMNCRQFKVKCWFVTQLITFTFPLFTATAQEVIVTAGINVSGNGGSLCYSVGQVVYQIHTTTNSSVVEGIQQPYRILALPEIKKATGIYLTITAFPNPTNEFLVLNIENFKNENLSFQIVDMHGKVLYTQKITVSQTGIDMYNLAPAIYMLQVMLDNKQVKTFKVVKN